MTLHTAEPPTNPEREFEGQASALPALPPAIPGLELASRFVPATGGMVLGGDFYDLFRLRDNAWGLVVGDVCGKGSEAAKLASLVRSTLRDLAEDLEDPLAVLADVNAALLREQSLGERFAAVVYAVLEQDTCGAWLTVSCGGHPLPILVRRAGWIDVRGQPGTVLGLFDEIDVELDRVGLGPGDSLVFCTDGITEARQSGSELFGDEGMLETLLRCAVDGCDAEQVADHLIAAAREHAGGSLDDDIAVMVVRIPPEADSDMRLRAVFGDDPVAGLPDYPVGEPSWGSSLRPAHPREARLIHSQDPSAAPAARAFVRSVLHSWRMSDLAEESDVALLVSEIVTNAVLHGGPPITVIVAYDGDRIRVEVGDGSLLLPRRRPASDQATTGRGLNLVEVLASDWGTQPTLHGKRVWFEVPAPPLA